MTTALPEEPDAAVFEILASRAIEGLPQVFREHLTEVTVQVRDFADRATLQDLEIDDPWELTGVYHGRPVGQSSAWEPGELPPIITLFRRPLLAEWQEIGGTLEELVHHVVVHEVAHHFGLSDDQIHAIESEAD